jgi:hypothetical protein
LGDLQSPFPPEAMRASTLTPWLAYTRLPILASSPIRVGESIPWQMHVGAPTRDPIADAYAGEMREKAASSVERVVTSEADPPDRGAGPDDAVGSDPRVGVHDGARPMRVRAPMVTPGHRGERRDMGALVAVRGKRGSADVVAKRARPSQSQSAPIARIGRSGFPTTTAAATRSTTARGDRRSERSRELVHSRRAAAH